MTLDIDFSLDDGVLVLEDTTTASSTGFDGTITVTHPDGFISTVEIDETGEVEVTLREDSDGNILQGVYVITYVNDQDVDDTLSIDFCYVAPTVNIECTVDYLCSRLTSRDLTSYTQAGVSSLNTTVTRTHTVSYPNATLLSNIVSAAQNVVVNPIYSGVFTTNISSLVVWNFGEYTVTATITGNKDCAVDEDNRLCSILCCMKEAYKRWQNAKCVNPKRAGDFEAAFSNTASIATLAYVSLSCGKVTDVAGYVAAAKSASGCSECDCDGGVAGTMIVPLCGTSTSNGEFEGSDSINITEEGVISVNTTWLNTFVSNIVSSLDLSSLEAQVGTNTSNITTLLEALAITQGNLVDTNEELGTLEIQFANHRIATFSYRFAWAAGTVTDNLDANDRIVDPNAVLMNSTTGTGFFQNPKVTWESASSFSPAKMTVELLAFDGELSIPTNLMNHVNIQAQLHFEDATGLPSARNVNIYVLNVKDNDSTALTFDVYFEENTTGLFYAMNYFANSVSFGGDAHISFLVTGKKG
jgi:hypothetical protein